MVKLCCFDGSSRGHSIFFNAFADLSAVDNFFHNFGTRKHKKCLPCVTDIPRN